MKKKWVKPELRQLNQEEAARYWEQIYKDYEALKLERLEKGIAC